MTPATASKVTKIQLPILFIMSTRSLASFIYTPVQSGLTGFHRQFAFKHASSPLPDPVPEKLEHVVGSASCAETSAGIINKPINAAAGKIKIFLIYFIINYISTL